MSALPTRDDLLTTRLQRFTRMLQGVESSDPRAIHQTRVASRRLRELLPILQLDHDVATKLGRRLRKVTRHLGAFRELDVTASLLNDLRQSWRSSSKAGRLLDAGIKRERNEVRRHHDAGEIAAEMERLARKIEKAVEKSRGARSPRVRRWVVEARVSRRAATARTSVEHAGALYLPDRLHTLRIAVKKFRYALELESEANKSPHEPDLRLLRQIQRTLGRLHDLQVLADRVRSVQASLPSGDLAVMRDLDALLVQVENACRQVHARYVTRRAGLLDVCHRHVMPDNGGMAHMRKAV
jgi:CHAD domain-containing protein